MDTDQQALVLEPGGGRAMAVGASTIRLLAVGGHTGGRSSVEEIGVPAGFTGPPPHVHNRTNHAWYVVEGELALRVAAATHHLGTGGFVYIPTGVAHTFANHTSRLGRILQFTTPGGFDRYLEEIAAAFPAGSDIDPEQMIEIMARHDTFPAPA